MRDHEKKNLIKIGIFVTFLLLCLGGYIFMIGAQKSFFESKFILKTQVKNSKGLKKGAMVQLKGILVGNVKDIHFSTLDSIEVEMQVKKDYMEWIRQDSRVSIKTQGLLGDTYVEIVGGSIESASVKEKDFLPVDSTSGFEAIVNKGEDTLRIATEVLTKLDIILGQIGKGNQLEKTMENLNRFSSSLYGVSENLKESTKQITQLTSNMNQVTQQIQKGPGSLHSLIYDNGVYQDLKTLLGGAQRNKTLQFFIRESIKKADQ